MSSGGCTGSAHDARVYSYSPLGRSPALFFNHDQFLFADSAYPVCREIIPAYRKPVNGGIVGENAVFNKSLSMIRVRVEHCIGILKNRFESLRSIRKVIKSKKDVGRLSVWIRCCCILHNILLQRGDVDDDFVATTVGNETEDDEMHGGQNVNEDGRDKRERIKRIVLATQ